MNKMHTRIILGMGSSEVKQLMELKQIAEQWGVGGQGVALSCHITI